MKTCTNGLPCPTSLQCNIGCYFNEADLHYSRAMHAPIHTRNGGNIITNGAALKPLHDGDDVSRDHDRRRLERVRNTI